MSAVPPGPRERIPAGPPPPRPVRRPATGVAIRVRRDLFGRSAPRLSRADREVLWLYLLIRTGIWITAYCARWLFPSDPDTTDPGPVLASFARWDWGLFLRIASEGYFPGRGGPWQAGWDNREAFFPGFPLLLRAVHAVVPGWTAAGLLISSIAGAVAVVALARITRLQLPDAGAGQRAVLFFLVSPCAVFLAVGYTESLFLAVALPAWLTARHRRWALAATLAALATAVRVSGLFLAAALALQFFLSVRDRRELRALPWLALPALPAFLYSWYLCARTGDWMAWKHAEERGWYRTLHTPWDAWSHTWHGAFDHVQTTGYAFMFQAELAAMLVGLLLVGLLIRQRRWPEALYVGLSLCALGTSYWYMSIPRATLLWWPLWIALAARSMRRPRFRSGYLCLVTPLTAVFALTFLSGRWAG
ncbi:membrane protein [Streptomyces albospinus]|uniref:Membrane protein n=1 Tax=Streptomyces albospinus TaxID=285515 RepID=A0ABQ2V8S9_9ACTN|nr:mannosyltransferase family protein [Streptomyces albospinus]GGU72612.1 membrane protein [Streptomyces albospinus]